MVRGRSTPVIFGGHFHVTRFGMFQSRAGLALNPWSTAAGSRLAYRHRPYLHTQDVIRTAPPSRSRVKNDYSIVGMLSRGKFSLCPFIFVMRGLDPRICRWREMAGSSPGHDVVGESEAGSETFAGMTNPLTHSLASSGADLIRASHRRWQMAVSSTAMTIREKRHARTWSAHLPLARDGRVFARP